MLIGGWHGWSHNRLCQLRNHPLFKLGFGLEDGEGSERLYSFSNSGAAAYRHTTKFHRGMYLDMIFARWDYEKYANLGTQYPRWGNPSRTDLPYTAKFLYNNYRQALALLITEEHIVAEAEELLSVKREDFIGYLDEELKFLESLKDEAPEVEGRVEYVKLLTQFYHISYV